MHKTGYTFYGWDVLGSNKFYWEGYGNNGGTIDIDSLPGRDVTLKARWNPLICTITYTGMDGAAAGENTPRKHTYGTDTVIPEPSRTGYAFAGWRVNGGTKAVKELTLGATDYTADITLEATWTAGTYSVFFEKNATDATGTMAAQEFTFEQTQALNANQFTRRGYGFSGWATYKEAKDADYLDEAQYTLTRAADATLYALWEAIEYTVTYYSDGAVAAAGDNPPTYTVDGEEATLTGLTKDGYTFAGWYTTSTFAAGTEITKLPGGHAEDLTLYAKWEEDVYTIRYDLGEASGATNPNKRLTKVAKGDVVTLKPASATGWIFEGWALSADTEALTRKEDGTTEHMPVDNVTYYAKWTHPRYTITYTPGEGIDPVPVTGHYSTRITEPTFTAPSGLKLLGWLDEDGNVWSRSYFPAEDVTLTAVWGLGDIESDEDFLAVAARSKTYRYKDTKIKQSIKLKADVNAPAGKQLDLCYLNGSFSSYRTTHTITITGKTGYKPLFGSWVTGCGDGCTISRIQVAFAEDTITVDHTSEAEQINWGLLIGKMDIDVTLEDCTVLGGSANGSESVDVNYASVWRVTGEPSENIGALVGYNFGGKIIDCAVGGKDAYVTMNIEAQHCAVYWIGGLVGRNEGTITYSASGRTASTKVVLGCSNGATSVGGLVGLMDNSNAKLTLSNLLSGMYTYTNYTEGVTGLLKATRGLLVGTINRGTVSIGSGATVYAEDASLPACGKINGGTVSCDNVTGSLWEIQ